MVVLIDRGSQFKRMLDNWRRNRRTKLVRATARHPHNVGKVGAVNKTLGQSFSLEFGSMDDGRRKLGVSLAWYSSIHYNSAVDSIPAQACGLEKHLVDAPCTIAHTFNLYHLLRAVTRNKRTKRKKRNLSPLT